MKTEKIKVFTCPEYTDTMAEEECVVLYEDNEFKMLFYNGYYNIELIIESKNKTWYQWGFDVDETKAINYLGGKKLAKYKQDLIHQGFVLMRKVDLERNRIHMEESAAWRAIHRPTTKEELDFLFNVKN